MSGGKVNITAAVPANKPVSNWWQHSGPIHTNSSKLSDKISRICLSSVCFQATKQTCAQRLWQHGPASPRAFLPHFYKGQFSVITVVWWQLWYLIVCLVFLLFFSHVIVDRKKKNAAQFATNNVQLQHGWIPNYMYVFFLHIYTDLFNYVYLYCPLSVLEGLQHSCLTPSITYQLS